MELAPIGIDSIVLGILGEEPTAAASLHEAFADRIYTVALRQLQSPADAEDVRGETLLRVVAAIRAGRLESHRALPAFVFGTARNVIREALRRRRRDEPLDDRDFPSTPAIPIDHTILRTINTVLSGMKPRERAIVRYHFYEELSREEISTRMGIHVDRVRLVRCRALKSFREAFQELSGVCRPL